ncbi:MAG: hypothetical protein V4695_12280 [Pseudomonadota bacterium]
MGLIALNRFWERRYPTLISVAVAAIAWYFGLRFDVSRISNQLSSTINISAILMGFTGTANAMLLSFNSKKFLAIRANKNLWYLLLTYFRSSLWAAMFVCFYSLLLFSIDITKIPLSINYGAQVEPFLMPVWIGSVVFALLSFFRLLRAVFGILKAE